MPLLISGPRPSCLTQSDDSPRYRIVPLQDRAYLFHDKRLMAERKGKGAVLSLMRLCDLLGIDVVGEGIDRSECATRVDGPDTAVPLCVVG